MKKSVIIAAVTLMCSGFATQAQTKPDRPNNVITKSDRPSWLLPGKDDFRWDLERQDSQKGTSRTTFGTQVGSGNATKGHLFSSKQPNRK